MKLKKFSFKGIKTGKTLVAPNNEYVSAYLEAARRGRGKAEKVLLGNKKK